MTLGFSSPVRLQKLKDELISWELYQVWIDKYHIMFWFETGHCLLNVAFRFSFHASDGSLDYVYDVQAQTDRKILNVDPILRRKITTVGALDERRLGLGFVTGDMLVIHDSPDMRSAWFYRYDPADHNGPLLWFEDDADAAADW